MKARKEILCDTGRNDCENWEEVWREGHSARLAGSQRAYARGARRTLRGNGEHHAADRRRAPAAGAGCEGDLSLTASRCSKRALRLHRRLRQSRFRRRGAAQPARSGQTDQRWRSGCHWPRANSCWDIRTKRANCRWLRCRTCWPITARSWCTASCTKTWRRFAPFWMKQSRHYAGGKEKLAAKVVGRWRDGTPVELSPDAPDPALTADPNRNVKFTFGPGYRRHTLPDRRAHPARQSARRLRILRPTGQPPAHYAPRPAVRTSTCRKARR